VSVNKKKKNRSEENHLQSGPDAEGLQLSPHFALLAVDAVHEQGNVLEVRLELLLQLLLKSMNTCMQRIQCNKTMAHLFLSAEELILVKGGSACGRLSEKLPHQPPDLPSDITSCLPPLQTNME
jgi:hypothetical protein